MMSRRILLLAVALAGMVMASTAEAFVCLQSNGRCVIWESRNAHLKFFLGAANRRLINGTFTFDENAIFAADEWNAIASSFRFSHEVGGQFFDPCGAQGARHACRDTGPIDDNPVFFTSAVCGRGFGDILAQTTNCYDPGPADMVNAPVFVNSNIAWDAYDGRLLGGVTDIRRVLAHEFGHVAGLIHPDDAGQDVRAMMNSEVSDIDRPQSDDINGLLTSYGSTGVTPSNTDACAIQPASGANSWWLWLPALALLRRRRAV
jgi:hypothetical protein